MRRRGERGIVLISSSSNVSVSIFTNISLSDSCVDDLDVVSTCVYWQAYGLYACLVDVRVPSRRREINGSRNCRCRVLGGRNSVSNSVLASLMNGWRGWTCGVGRLSARRGDPEGNVWRTDGEVALLPPPHSRTPGLYSRSVR